MSDSGDSRDEINAKGMERDVMPAVRPTIPSTPEKELKTPFRDLFSANDEKDFQARTDFDTKSRGNA